jgi:peptidyl-prolyl cis-trans isomerase D
VNKLEGLLTDGLTASDQEIQNLYAHENEKVDVTFVKVPFAQFKEGAKVSDSEVADYYEKNRERFRKPDGVKVAYIPYDPEHFAERCRSTSRRSRSTTTPTRPTTSSPSASTSSTSSSGPARCRRRAKSRDQGRRRPTPRRGAGRGKDEFSELAKKNSEDTLSVENGGDLGVVARGALEAPARAGGLQPRRSARSATSSRARAACTSSGSRRRSPAGPKPLADVRDEILKELRRAAPTTPRATALAADLDRARGGTALDDVASGHGLTVTTSPLRRAVRPSRHEGSHAWSTTRSSSSRTRSIR